MVFFGRPGSGANDFDVLEVIDFDRTHPNQAIQVSITPNGDEPDILFERSGLRQLTSASTIVLTGRDRRMTITVSGAGSVKLKEIGFR